MAEKFQIYELDPEGNPFPAWVAKDETEFLNGLKAGKERVGFETNVERCWIRTFFLGFDYCRGRSNTPKTFMIQIGIDRKYPNMFDENQKFALFDNYHEARLNHWRCVKNSIEYVIHDLQNS